VKRKLKVGVVGAGTIARRGHVPSFAALADVELVAVCDARIERARALAEEFAIPKVFADYRKLVREEIDAVCVCTPNKFHAPVSIAALRAGKHVMCEKPLATTKNEVARMLDAAAKAGRLLMGAFSFRYRAEMQALSRFVGGGHVGKIYYAKACWLRRRGLPGFGSWFTQKELAGGGVLLDVGVHVLDGVLFLMGMPKAVAVSGQTFLNFRNGKEFEGIWGYPNVRGKTDVEDAVCTLIRLENGGIIVLEASWALNMTEPEILNIMVMGEKGGATYNPLKGMMKVDGQAVEVTFPNAGAIDPYHAEARDFVNSIKTGKAPLGRAEDALIVAEIMDAVYKSAAKGAEVKLNS